jgi:ATP-binding cassette subfamily F protein uup
MRRLGELSDLRKAFREHQRPEGTAKLEALGCREISGKLVIEARASPSRFGDRVLVDRDLSLRVHRGDRIGIVGPNGAGKTTLVKLLTGELAPDAGTMCATAAISTWPCSTSGATRSIRTDNARAFPDRRPRHTLIVNGEQKHVVSYMKDFLFKPEQARTPVRELSGGEKARLILARTLAQPANLLVLDEPTNDLDMETLDLLQELIDGLSGHGAACQP